MLSCFLDPYRQLMMSALMLVAGANFLRVRGAFSLTKMVRGNCTSSTMRNESRKLARVASRRPSAGRGSPAPKRSTLLQALYRRLAPFRGNGRIGSSASPHLLHLCPARGHAASQHPWSPGKASPPRAAAKCKLTIHYCRPSLQPQKAHPFLVISARCTAGWAHVCLVRPRLDHISFSFLF